MKVCKKAAFGFGEWLPLLQEIDYFSLFQEKWKARQVNSRGQDKFVKRTNNFEYFKIYCVGYIVLQRIKNGFNFCFCEGIVKWYVTVDVCVGSVEDPKSSYVRCFWLFSRDTSPGGCVQAQFRLERSIWQWNFFEICQRVGFIAAELPQAARLAVMTLHL